MKKSDRPWMAPVMFLVIAAALLIGYVCAATSGSYHPVDERVVTSESIAP